MWIFQCTADEDRKFIVLPGKDYVVGRRDCDIVIENDQSVSRKHATLRVTHPEANIANVHKPATLTLTDVSKFGTFVNNRKVKGQEKVLQSGDEVWSLFYMMIIVLRIEIESSQMVKQKPCSAFRRVYL